MKKIFIETKGNDDSGNGSERAPFATLQRAISSLSENEETQIYVGEGTFFFSQPVLIPEISGSLTLSGAPGAKTVFSGAMPLQNLSWNEHNGIFSAQLQCNLNIDRLFVNGQEQVLARYPNRDETQPLCGCTTAKNIKKRTAGYKSVVGAHLQAIHEHAWGGNSFLVLGKDSAAPHGLCLKWVGDNNRGSGIADSMMIENVFEELDAPCEWYYNNETGQFYYIPPASFDINTARFEACTNAEILKISDTANVKIENIKFARTARTLFSGHLTKKEYVPLLRGDWCVMHAGAVFVENADSVQISRCVFEHIGGNALFFYGRNRKHLVLDNEFFSVGATAVQIIGKPKCVWEPSFWPNEKYPEQTTHKTQVNFPKKIGAKEQDFPEDILISNNHIRRVGLYEKQSAGINLSVSSRIKILHNTIHDSPRSNININDGTFGGHEIAFNDIFDSQKETQDHGPFNSWGRDRFWSVPKYNASGESGETLRNYEKDGKHYDITQIDAWQTTRIHNNRFHHDHSGPHSWGIDLDDGSSNYEIYNNLILGIGIKLREGFERRVYNNILIGGEIQIHVPYAECNDDISRNLVVAPGAFGFAGVDKKRFTKSGIKIQSTWHFWPKKTRREHIAPLPVCRENPHFLNPKENDYTVTNTEAMKIVGFENFEMKAFGKQNCAYYSPAYEPENILLPVDTKKTRIFGTLVSDIDDAALSATASSNRNGVYVQQTETEFGTEETVFLCGDIIREFNGEKIKDCADLAKKLKRTKDERLIFMVYRTGKVVQISKSREDI